MAKNLLIVESPAKVKTIKKFIGNDFDVRASMGHVKDLPEKKLGVDIENNFKPEYIVIPEKKKVLAELKKAAARSDKVYLAPDPDREGEAIAWHIAREIGKNSEDIFRATFNEITAKAVQNAIKNPGKLDEKKFNAQQARRILDRLVGYKISPLLWKKVRWGLSAGRVQSVALRLVCEREKAINEFVPKEYWTVEVLFEKEGKQFWAKVIKHKGNKLEINNQMEAERIAQELEKAEFVVENVERKERKKNAPPPFITSILQQDASRRLGFSPKKTMLIAQHLYEGVEIEGESVGLITYMRTDSFRVADEAVDSARKFILEKYGNDYLPANPPKFKARKSAQEAHEAIRPTSMEYNPERVKKFLKKDEFALYELIWKRFLACQMSPAIYDQTGIDIMAGEYSLRASGSVLKFPGFLSVYTEIKEESKNGEEEIQLPELKTGERLPLKDIKKEQHFTQPPPRYTEATLVKELEEKGIGRPSTYATIVSTIQERNYVVKQKGKLYPTQLGCQVNELLTQNFPDLIDITFTAEMEENLDKIEEGELEWTNLLKNFYSSFEKDLNIAQKKMKNIKSEGISTDIVCSQCGGKMVIKLGKKGEFLACSNYPECKNTKNFTTGEDGRIKIIEDERTDIKCDLCGSPMVRRQGPYGQYLACSNYPECKNTISLNNSKPVPTGVKCPSCGGEIMERKGRRGSTFYGCSNYPKCKYTLKYRPVPEKCPKCGHPFLVRKDDSGKLICPQEGCGYGE
jgi:DNA topoisomerase-1